jgi:hypothetical protein
LEKASPLNTTSMVVFVGYLANHTLYNHIASFCTVLDLLCTQRMEFLEDKKVIVGDADFQSYHGK